MSKNKKNKKQNKFRGNNRRQNAKRAKSPEDFFITIDIGEFIDKVRKFRNNISPRMSAEEIRDSLLNILTFNGEFKMDARDGDFPRDTYFFRVREYDDNDPSLKTESGFWNPPNEVVTEWGRFNRPGVSKLYTAAKHQQIALEEMKHITEKKPFVLIAYKAKQTIKSQFLGDMIEYKNFKSEKAKTAAKVYNDFLRTELTRDVGKETEYLYKISTILSEVFHDTSKVHNAFYYPCVKRQEMHNTCFRGENIRNLLDFQWAMQLEKCGADYNYTHIVEDFSETGKAIYKPKFIKIPEEMGFCLKPNS